MSYEVSPLLEGKLKQLYTDHLERSNKVDWSYASLIPWERGRNYESDPWSPEQVTISPGLYVAVETALLTEVNLPWFTSGLSNSFRGELEVLQDFIRTWTSEEDQHGNVLNTYLLLTRNSDPIRLHHLRKAVIRGGWEPRDMTPFQAMAYTAAQELATKVYYLNVARVADTEDPNLAHILRSITKDETLHYAFYRDVVKAHLELNPNYVEPLVDVLMGFMMPGYGMPDIAERVRLTELNGIYTLEHYYTQVLQTLMKVWDIPNLKPTAATALEAMVKLNNHLDRMARLVGFAERKRAKHDPEARVESELIAAGWRGPMLCVQET